MQTIKSLKRTVLAGGLALAAVFSTSLLSALPAAAVPARVILLRHGEKGGPLQLCSVGQERARALVDYYLGKNAKKSLFKPGEAPTAILGLSLHTLETIDPVADSWKQPVVFYSVMPEMVDGKLIIRQDKLAERNRQAVHDVFTKPEWAGGTLIMDWEHDHIARPRLDIELTPAQRAKVEEKHPGRPVPTKATTLFDLMDLAGIKMPDDWPGDTYDYFWIIDFDQQTGLPSAFTMIKQEFGPPYENLPQNDWGTPENISASAGCTK